MVLIVFREVQDSCNLKALTAVKEMQLKNNNGLVLNLMVKAMCIFSPKDLDALLEKDKTLEEESKNLTESLAKQKEKYEQLQVHTV